MVGNLPVKLMNEMKWNLSYLLYGWPRFSTIFMDQLFLEQQNSFWWQNSNLANNQWWTELLSRCIKTFGRILNFSANFNFYDKLSKYLIANLYLLKRINEYTISFVCFWYRIIEFVDYFCLRFLYLSSFSLCATWWACLHNKTITKYIITEIKLKSSSSVCKKQNVVSFSSESSIDIIKICSEKIFQFII